MKITKFKDIPRFPHSNYVIDVEWNHLKGWLKDIKDDIGLDFDPPYQRGYVWNEDQKIAYVEYCLRGGFSGKDIFWNSARWQGGGMPGVMEIVDGKQRVSAVLDFLDNKFKAFGSHYSEFTDSPRLMEGRFKFHINNLETPLEVVKWYLGMNQGGSIHTEKDLAPAYEFLNKLENEN